MLAENYERQYRGVNTGINASLHAAFQHSPLISFTTENAGHCNKTVQLPLHKSMDACKTAWVMEHSEEFVLRNQGECFAVLVPAIVLTPKKIIPVVGRQSPLSSVCLYWWKSAHQLKSLQSTIRWNHRSETCLPTENTLSLLQSDKQRSTLLGVCCGFYTLLVTCSGK